METDCAREFLPNLMDRRPRKRPRVNGDAPQSSKAQSGLYNGQDIGNDTSNGPSKLQSEDTNHVVKGRRGSPPCRDDDQDGHYVFELGENLTPRYKILKKLGEGTFGQVLNCFDRETRENVAIKVIRSLKKYRDAAMTEINVLRKLERHNGHTNGCVQIQNWFDYRSHICIVFEMLGPSIFDFLRRNRYRSFPVDLVCNIGRQLLECVAFMHNLHLIHTDLKPENILFVSSESVEVPDYKCTSRDRSQSKKLPKSSAIKVIDFGSTTIGHHIRYYTVSTRHYRAPEDLGGIINAICGVLAASWQNYGSTLFQTHDSLEHLAMMERVLGKLPEHMLQKVDRNAEKYIRRGRLNWPEGATSRESIKAVQKLPRLQNWVMQSVDHSAGDLIDLLQGLLQHEPTRRITPRKALRHPFFMRNGYKI
ncbi:hypothetical protein V2J09_003906 [Rumex salicifolius]